MIVFIHRKDLRLDDLTAYPFMHQLDAPVLPLLILDPELLKHHRQQAHSGRFFLSAVRRLRQQYRAARRELAIYYGEPSAIMDALCAQLPVTHIVYHLDATPYAKLRERRMRQVAAKHAVALNGFLDHMLADAADFQSFVGREQPYKVFTPYYKQWRQYLSLHAPPQITGSLTCLPAAELPVMPERFQLPPDLARLIDSDLEGSEQWNPSAQLARFARERAHLYEQQRDYYAQAATSGISGYLNHGMLSLRQAYHQIAGVPGIEPWIRQLAWRDFYAYQALYDPWFFRYESLYDFSELSEDAFAQWASAETGIPIIDAAMTELNEQGTMPNRLRMITAMFLTKNLLVPFYYGERYFRYKLSDYDNALNRGGWLWSSSLGFDAAPYFRIMNPVTQSMRWDAEGAYIRRWLPHMHKVSGKAVHQPQPQAIVDLKRSRARAIAVYKRLLQTKRHGEGTAFHSENGEAPLDE